MRITTILLMLALVGCSDHHDPIEVERSKMRTDGWLEGDGWVETERRLVGSKVYIKNETATEIRWVEVLDHGLGRSRVMRRDERVPR